MAFSRLIWGFVFVAAAFAQDTPVIKTNVRQVLVPVAVTDAKGRHVRGLKRADFQVLEDAVPQEVVAFSIAGDSGVAPVNEAAVTGTNAQARSTFQRASSDPAATYLLCIDTLHSSIASLTRIRDAVNKAHRFTICADRAWPGMAGDSRFRARCVFDRDCGSKPRVSKRVSG